MSRIRIIDSTLRDGSHAVSHGFTPDDMVKIALAMERANIDTIEIGHGDGLGGSSRQYGLAVATDAEWVQAVTRALTTTKVAVLLLPGIGIKEELEMAAEAGAKVARIACHCTEADIGEQHVRLGKDLGMEVFGLTVMSHMVSPEKLAEQARMYESYGADGIYMMESAGTMLPDGVRASINAMREAVKVPIGFHGHNNLSMAVANAVAAVEAGATMIDGTLCGMGGGAGNAPTEVVIAVFNKLGIETGVDLYAIMDAAEDVVRPMMRRPITIDRASLSLGYAGVYSSFLLHTYRAAAKFGVEPRDILMELGRRRTVGGQEDMIIDVAAELAARKTAR